MSATAVFALLNDTDPSNDPFILSIRSASQYATGHIPGAINIARTSLFTDENLSKLPTDDTLIVVVCYTGHTASITAALLNANGFNATVLKYGMTSWTDNETVAPYYYDRETMCMNYPVVIGTHPGTMADGEVVGPPVVDVLGVTRDYLAMGKPLTITANALYANLNDGFTGNDPFILSIRKASDYEKGHIPGAVNIDRKGLFTEENLSKLPFNKQIVVVCYTGHSASQVTAVLGLAGYDAITLKFGMGSWTTNTTVAGSYYHRDTDVGNYPVFIGEEPGDMGNATTVGSRQCGDDNGGGASGPIEGADVSEIAHNYMNSGKPLTMKASDVFALLNDTDPSNDPFILSIRSASQYAKGHIPGAVNIGFRNVFTDENLSKLPHDDTLIVVVCYTGHSASQMAAMLNMNGFNATAMKFGMTSWTDNETVAPSFYVRETDAKNFPVVIGPDPGTIADGVVVGPPVVDVLGATRDYLAMGKPATISASVLYANLNDGYSGNDPFILSIRSASQYEKGHIPGAVNIGRKSLFTEENLSLLPTNKQIVVVCYTGHSASQVTALLNLAGYDAVALKFGMTSWSTNTTVAPSAYDRDKDAHNYPVFIGEGPGDMANSTTVGRQCGDDDNGGTVTQMEGADVSEVANNYMNSGKPLTMKAPDLFALLNDTNTTNDPFVLSIRSASQYAKGHIPGAINIGFRDVFTDENLSKLPHDDTLIVVVCYTGHTASQMAAMLNVNGYNATALKFGMTSWTNNETVAPAYYDRATMCMNYPIINSTEPGTWADGEIVGKTDAEIIMEASIGYMQAGPKLVNASVLYDLLNDTDATNDPFVLSIRPSALYELGHVPGSVNMDWRSLFTLDKLSELPQNESMIVVVSETGQTAGQITALLNVLGYNASSLEFGMSSWTRNSTIVPGAFNNTTDQADYGPGRLSNVER
jgi:rhodanese-related sulfurtransferase